MVVAGTTCSRDQPESGTVVVDGSPGEQRRESVTVTGRVERDCAFRKLGVVDWKSRTSNTVIGLLSYVTNAVANSVALSPSCIQSRVTDEYQSCYSAI